MSNYFKTESEKQRDELAVDAAGKSYMLEAARWTKFIGITHAVILILACVSCLILPPIMTAAGYVPPYTFTLALVTSLLAIAVNIYPIYAMLRSSSLIRAGIQVTDQSRFNEGLKMVRNYVKFIGILVIVSIFLYGIMIIFQVVANVTAAAV